MTIICATLVIATNAAALFYNVARQLYEENWSHAALCALGGIGLVLLGNDLWRLA